MNKKEVIEYLKQLQDNIDGVCAIKIDDPKTPLCIVDRLEANANHKIGIIQQVINIIETE